MSKFKIESYATSSAFTPNTISISQSTSQTVSVGYTGPTGYTGSAGPTGSSSIGTLKTIGPIKFTYPNPSPSVPYIINPDTETIVIPPNSTIKEGFLWFPDYTAFGSSATIEGIMTDNPSTTGTQIIFSPLTISNTFSRININQSTPNVISLYTIFHLNVTDNGDSIIPPADFWITLTYYNPISN